MKVKKTVQTLREFILTEEEAFALKVFLGGTSHNERKGICSNKREFTDKENWTLSQMYSDLDDGFRSE